MTRYTGDGEAVQTPVVGARNTPGHGAARPKTRENGVLRSRPPAGWRNRRQKPSSRAPPQGIRRKAQPDTEGIETRGVVPLASDSIRGRRKAQPDTEGIETLLIRLKLTLQSAVAKPSPIPRA